MTVRVKRVDPSALTVTTLIFKYVYFPNICIERSECSLRAAQDLLGQNASLFFLFFFTQLIIVINNQSSFI